MVINRRTAAQVVAAINAAPAAANLIGAATVALTHAGDPGGAVPRSVRGVGRGTVGLSPVG